MNIGFLTSEYPHPRTKGSGGIATSIKNLASGMVEKGLQPVVLVYGQNEDAVFEDNGITIYKIKNVKFKGISFFLTQNKIQKCINTLHDAGKIDVVETPDWCGITSFIRPKKCKIVVRLHGSDTYFCSIENRPSKWFNRFVEHRALKRADHIISVSAFTASYTNKLFQLNREITVIPNGINLNYFTNKNEGVAQNNILYFGTLIRKKGCLELPLIFNILHEKRPDVNLILIGGDSPDQVSGSQSTWNLMQPLFNEEALKKVQYLGRKPYSEMRSFIENSKICVFPSFAEALPVSWIEAMALGKGIVASNIGWANELITHNTDGYLVDPKDHERYAQYIDLLINDHALLNSFEKKAREKVESHFDILKIADTNLNFYKNVIRQSFSEI